VKNSTQDLVFLFFLGIFFSILVVFLTGVTWRENDKTRTRELKAANFEQVGNNTYRRKTADGWELVTDLNEIPTIVIPDPEHKWELPSK